MLPEASFNKVLASIKQQLEKNGGQLSTVRSERKSGSRGPKGLSNVKQSLNYTEDKSEAPVKNLTARNKFNEVEIVNNAKEAIKFGSTSAKQKAQGNTVIKII